MERRAIAARGLQHTPTTYHGENVGGARLDCHCTYGRSKPWVP